jgi:Holliday junction resolvase RusA-like endonuclease
MIKFTIPLTPRTKKNSHQMRKNWKTGKMYPAPSKAFEQFQRDAGWYIPNKGAMIDKPVNVKCEFYFESDLKVDQGNLISAIDDILVHYKVLADDNSKIIVSHDGSRVYLKSGRNGVDMEIEEV